MGKNDADAPRCKNWKTIIFLIIAAIAVAVIFLLNYKDSLFRPSFKARVSRGATAPDFTFPGLDGKNVSLSDFRGKVVFLNIWATWCPPCREEMPSMERLYRELKGTDFEILAVSIDAAGADVVAPFMRENNLTFPALLDTKGAIQNLYGTTGVPESFIINRQGIIEEAVIGPRNWADPEAVLFFRNLLQKQ